MIAQELEIGLHNAFIAARKARSVFMSTKHLLLAVLEPNSSASNALHACGVTLDPLREELSRLVANEPQPMSPGRELDTQPTIAFQRVLQQAILSVQASKKNQVTSADVLLALLEDEDVTEILARRGVTSLALKNQMPPMNESPQIEVELPELAQPELESAEDLQIVLFNDDHTPMQFVVDVLQLFFSMSKEDATELMLEVHRDGKAVCGLYAKQDAIDIVKQVRTHARQHKHPFRCGLAVPK
jgi:ATP-dependent Clp protease adapter protein ClpS